MDVEVVGLHEPCSHEDGQVVLAESGELLLSDLVAGDRPHSQFAQERDLLVERGHREAIPWDARVGGSAQLRKPLIYCHVEPAEGEIVGDREPGGTAPHDRYRVPLPHVARLRVDDRVQVVEPLRREPLEPADRDRLTLQAHAAHALALARADHAAHLGHGVVVVYDAHRTRIVPVPDGRNVVGYVHVRRAGGHADATLDAARGLPARLILRVSKDDLGPARDALLRGQHRHRHALGIEDGELIAVLPPALLARAPRLAVDARSEAEDVGVVVDPHVLVRHAERARRTHVDAQGTPAAAAVVDTRPEAGVSRLDRVDLHQVDGLVLADARARAAADALVRIVHVPPAVAGRAGPHRPGLRDGVWLGEGPHPGGEGGYDVLEAHPPTFLSREGRSGARP